MDTIVIIAQILLSLTILVGLHEMGHLLTAKMFGMRVEQFSIGFPPKVFSFKYGETEYALSAIPLGGFVKISGMIDESLDTEAMSQEPQPWEFRSKPAWQRLIVMLGGIIVNVILGITIFILLTFTYGDSYLKKDAINDNGGVLAYQLAQEIGLQTGDQIIKLNGSPFDNADDIIKPDFLLTENAYYTVLRDGKEVDIQVPSNFIENFNSDEVNFVGIRVPTKVDTVLNGKYGDLIGLQKGDEIVAINNNPVGFQDQIKPLLVNRVNDTLTVSVIRNGSQQELVGVMPADSSILSIGFEDMRRTWGEKYSASIQYSFMEAVPEGTKRAFGIVFLQLKAFGKIFSGDINPGESVSGPIGIAKAFGTTWEAQRFWRLTGFLSMVLAFMNLLPIPALDGGHVMFLSWEIITGRKPSDKFLEIAQKIGMIILLTLMVLILGNDIRKLIIEAFNL